ncbi:MAG TPA: DUF1778 domain-containing protein [Rhizomicrobium sp.]
MARAVSARRPKSAARSGVVNIRVRPDERALIDSAASAQGKSRSDFMLEASRRAAEEALLNQTVLRVDAATWGRFVALLDAPPRPNSALRRLMLTKAPWD